MAGMEIQTCLLPSLFLKSVFGYSSSLKSNEALGVIREQVTIQQKSQTGGPLDISAHGYVVFGPNSSDLYAISLSHFNWLLFLNLGDRTLKSRQEILLCLKIGKSVNKRLELEVNLLYTGPALSSTPMPQPSPAVSPAPGPTCVAHTSRLAPCRPFCSLRRGEHF